MSKIVAWHVERSALLENASACFGRQQRHVLNAAKGILLDWDGCVAIQNRVFPAARELIARHADRVAIVSNNSTHLPSDFADILRRQGVHIPAERILLAGTEAVREIATEEGARVLLLAAPKMKAYAREAGLILVRENADLVLLMRDVNFSYGKLRLAANALRSGARLVVANSDISHPGPAGSIVPETGALLAALQACSGDAASSPRFVGKPAGLMFERACARLGIAPTEAVMIGDNPHTDGEGAIKAGIYPIMIGGNSAVRLEHLV